MSRAVSIDELYNYKANTIKVESPWLEFMGEPERSGSILIWGNSANGKTTFALQLCKYLASFERVAYNSLEQGRSKSMQDAFQLVRMEEVKKRLILLHKEPITELIERLQKHKSPNIVAIDSVQYTGMNYNDYKALKDMFPKKLFILISHADGKEPRGNVAKSIRYDADVKINVEGFRATAESRYGGGTHYIIWPEKAAEYWGEL